MCVGSVCTQPPYNDKIHPVSFLSTKIFTSFSNRAVCLRDVTRMEAPPTTVVFQHRLHWYLTSDPPWVSSHQLFHRQSRCRRMIPKRLSCFVVGCNNEHSSSHLLRHLSRWRGLSFVWRECALNLPKCVYVRTNLSWSSFTYWRSEYKVF